MKAETKNFSINCSGVDIDNETNFKINDDISSNESQLTTNS